MKLNPKQVEVLGKAIEKHKKSSLLKDSRKKANLLDKSHFSNFKNGRRQVDDENVRCLVEGLGLDFTAFKNLSEEHATRTVKTNSPERSCDESEEDVFFESAAALLWSYAGRKDPWAGEMTRLLLELLDRVIAWKKDYTVRQLITIFDSLSSYFVEGRDSSSGMDLNIHDSPLAMWNRWLVHVWSFLLGISKPDIGKIDRRVAIPWCYLLRIKALRHRRYAAVAQDAPKETVDELGRAILDAFKKCLEIAVSLRRAYDNAKSPDWSCLSPRRDGRRASRAVSQEEQVQHTNAVQARLVHIAVLENHARYLMFSSDPDDVKRAWHDIKEALRLCHVVSPEEKSQKTSYVFPAPYENGSPFRPRFCQLLSDVKYTLARFKDYAGGNIAYQDVMEDYSSAVLWANDAYALARKSCTRSSRVNDNAWSVVQTLETLVRVLVAADRYANLHTSDINAKDRDKMPHTYRLFNERYGLDQDGRAVSAGDIFKALPYLFNRIGFSLPWECPSSSEGTGRVLARHKPYWDFAMYMWLELERLVHGDWNDDTVMKKFAKVVLLYTDLTCDEVSEYDQASEGDDRAQCRDWAREILELEAVRRPYFKGMSAAERLHLGLRVLSEYDIGRKQRYAGEENRDKIEPSGFVRWVVSHSCPSNIGRTLEADALPWVFLACVRADVQALMRHFRKVGYAKFYRGVLRHEGEIPTPDEVIGVIGGWMSEGKMSKYLNALGKRCARPAPECVKRVAENADADVITAEQAYLLIHECLPHKNHGEIAEGLGISAGRWSQLRKDNQYLSFPQAEGIACILDVGVSDLSKLSDAKGYEDSRRQEDASFVRNAVLPKLRSLDCRDPTEEKTLDFGLRSLCRAHTDFDHAFITKILGEYAAIEWERIGSNSKCRTPASWMRRMKSLIEIGLCGRNDMSLASGLRETVRLLEISDRGDPDELIAHINETDAGNVDRLWTCTAIRLLSGVSAPDLQKLELRQAHDRLSDFLKDTREGEHGAEHRLADLMLRSDLALVKMRSCSEDKDEEACLDELIKTVGAELEGTVGRQSCRNVSDAIVLLHLGRMCGHVVRWADAIGGKHGKARVKPVGMFAKVVGHCLSKLEDSPAKKNWKSVSRDLPQMRNRVAEIMRKQLPADFKKGSPRRSR